MSTDVIATLDRWRAAMEAYDLEGVAACCHPDIRLGLHFAELPLPFVGETIGRDAARRRTQQIFDSWLFPHVEIEIRGVAPPIVRCRAAMTIQHRWTGVSIDTYIRQVFRIENDLIRSFDGYLDAPRFAAFLRMVGLSPAGSDAKRDIAARSDRR